MNLYLVKTVSGLGYDTYDSVVVAANNEADARLIHPSKYVTHHKNGDWMGTFLSGPHSGCEYDIDDSSWVSFSDIRFLSVELIGTTTKDRGVILASFNAG